VQLDALYRDHIDRLQREYARVLEETGFDGVVIHSGTPQRKSIYDDQYWPLRPVPHFQHWLPLAQADCALLIVPGRQPRLLRNVAISFWEGKVEPESDHFWSSFEVIDVNGPEAIAEHLPAGKKIAFIGENVTRAEMWKSAVDASVAESVGARLDLLRSIKSAYESLCIAEANRRASAGHQAVLDLFYDGDYSELQLHLKYLEATCQDDPETPYKNIVALGENAATLHHVDYGRYAGLGAQSLLIDAGAAFNGYHSDITRTAVKGDTAAAGIFAALVDKLESLQREMCSRVRTGLPYQQLHNESHELLAGVLRDVGIATASESELIEAGVTRRFLPHGLGHSLGLQTHDVGCALVKPDANNPFLRNTSTIEVGQVFTIEPGCYFIRPLLEELRASPHAGTLDWKLVDQLAPFGGVRIEDDLEVVDGGSRNLTREVL
jgi:Xaa-Pro dipeptidase